MRLATILASLVFATIASPTSAACTIAGPAVSYFHETVPDDLGPNEIVLEVRFVGQEEYKAPPFYSIGEVVRIGRSVSLRFAVVSVVHGAFHDSSILIPTSTGCGGIWTTPPGGAGTGLVIGYPTPPAAGWNDAPALIARSASYSDDWGWRQSTRPKPDRAVPEAEHPDRGVTSGLKFDLRSFISQLTETRDPYVRKEHFEHAASMLRARVDRGDTSAMVDLALALEAVAAAYETQSNSSGQTSPQNQAVQLLERAAALGDARAMFVMAEHESHERRTMPVAERAATRAGWYLRAAENGHVCAMGRMAQSYRFAWGVPENSDKALFWYRKAVASGAIMSPYGYEIEGDPPPGAPYAPPLECPREPA